MPHATAGAPTGKREQILQAIAHRHRLVLAHNQESPITIEPHLVGKLNGQDALLCWQLAPPIAYGMNWRLLSLNRIEVMAVLDSVQ